MIAGSEKTPLRTELHRAMWLALVPVGVAFAFGVLLLPRAAWPDGVPLPVPDPQGLARAAARDHALAEQARRSPLPADVRALGTAIREFHWIEARGGADSAAISRARGALDSRVRAALPQGKEAVLALRAVQLESFLQEIERFERTGVQSPELASVAGNFVGSMQVEGWARDQTVIASEGALRAMFKEMWDALLGLDKDPDFAVPLDEERALYALYLGRPHPSPSMRDALAAARRGARDAAACEAVREGERAAVEAWRIDRIARLAAIDPTYPATYARGLAQLRRGEYARAAEDLERWMREHPDGPYALRARSYWRAAAFAAAVE